MTPGHTNTLHRHRTGCVGGRGTVLTYGARIALLTLILLLFLPGRVAAAPPPPTFTAPTPFATGSSPNFAAIADFNGDGKPDLVVANEGGTSVSVLLNTTATGATTPTFTAQATFAAGSRSDSVAVGDFNGDGKPDIVVTNFGSNTVSVLLNTTATGATTPTFTAQATFPVGSGPFAVAVTDVNGDGKPDLVVANSVSNTVSVLLNTTATGATTPTFTAQATFPVGSAPGSVAVADVNGDGKPDLVVANFGSTTVSVLLNTTATGAATPTFTAQTPFTVGNKPVGVAVTDFNGDGKPDIVVTNYTDDTVGVLLNTTATGATTPTFAPQAIFTVGSVALGVAVGDVNGDGKPDIVVANNGSNTVGVLLNTTATGAATPTFTAQTTFPVGRGPGRVVAADFNGDGKLDLAVTNFGSATVSVLLNTTAPVLAPTTLPAATVGTAFSQVFTPSGGAGGPYTVTLATGSSLPPGLTLMNNTLSGTPTTGGTFTFTLTATDNGGNSGSQSYTLTVGKAATTTTMVTANPNPAVFGQPITLSATVTSMAMGVTPTGTVTFTSGGTTLGSGTVNSMGVATATATLLPVGANQTITATYNGDANFTGSTGTTTTTVNKAVTTTTMVTANPNPAVFGQPVALSATVSVTAPGAGTPTGTVTFTSGGTTLGGGTVNGMGVAMGTTTLLPVGANQTITATYNGDANFTGSTGTTTVTVNAQTLTVTAPTGTGSGNTGSATLPVIRTGATLALSATLPNGMPATGVTYTSSNTGVLGVNPTTGVVTGAAGGTATITVTGANGASGSITITVTPATGSGLVPPAPQPMVRASAGAVAGATALPQPVAHPTSGDTGSGTSSGGGGTAPRAGSAPTATPLPQPAGH